MSSKYDFWMASANAYAILYKGTELFHYYRAYRNCLAMAKMELSKAA